MIISRRWLAKYVQLDIDDAALNKALTFSGIEVEAVKHLPALPPQVISARVVHAEALAGSDHLKVCKVDTGDGSEPRQVVCGAANCHSGMLAVLAMPGAVLGDLTIKSARLRGAESHGMLCSERELGISDDHSGIIQLPEGTPLGVSVNDLYELPDTIFELEITPNRPDLLGYFGIARDLSASLGLPLSFPELITTPGRQDGSMALKLEIRDPELCPRYTARLFDHIQIGESPLWIKSALIKTGLRPINNVVDITNYVMLETGHPLHAFDYDVLAGEHENDACPAIIVRRAKEKETFFALDGKDHCLETRDLVIADGQKPSALAGVMGGKLSAIGDQTSRVVLEAAAFHPGTIRKTSYEHKISTDSSYRFERHLSPVMAPHVSARAAELFVQVAGGEAVGDLIDAYPAPLKPWMLGLRPCRFELLIGYKMEEKRIIDFLAKLGLKFMQYGNWQDAAVTDPSQITCYHAEQEKAGVTEFDMSIECDHALWFAIPPWRVDLTREADLLEELARLDGYDKVPVKTLPSMIMDRHAYKIRNKVAEYLIGLGFFETLSYSFNDPQQIKMLGIDPEENTQKLLNPQSSNQALMRVSLLPQLMEHVRYNLNHGERDLKLMELARTYPAGMDHEPLRCTALLTGNLRAAQWQNPPRQTSFYDVKAVVEGLFEMLNLSADRISACPRPWLMKSHNLGWFVEDQAVAMIGSVDPLVADRFGIDLSLLGQELWFIDIDLEKVIELTRNQTVIYKELPRFPGVSRDLSFLIPSQVSWADISRLVRSVDVELITSVEVFDEYRGKQIPEGFRSLSIRLTMRDKEKTLTDERIDALVDSVVKLLIQECQIQMR